MPTKVQRPFSKTINGPPLSPNFFSNCLIQQKYLLKVNILPLHAFEFLLDTGSIAQIIFFSSKNGSLLQVLLSDTTSFVC